MNRPFKKFFTDDEAIFAIPKGPFKVWWYHYSLEGAKNRCSWPKLETIARDCKLGINTVKRARAWLVKHKWIVKVGYVQLGEYRIPKYRVEKGEVPKKTPRRKTKNGAEGTIQNGAYGGVKNGTAEVDVFEVDILEVEGTMKADKQIRILSLQILGIKAERYENLWEEVEELTAAFGHQAVIDAFEAWARSQDPDSVTKPVTAFLSVATGILKGIRTGGVNPAAKQLILDLSEMSKGEVTFLRKHAEEIARLLNSFSAEDIKAAFGEFLGKLDDFKLRTAGKDFSETAEQIVYTLKKQRQDIENLELMRKQIDEKESQRVAETLKAIENEPEEICELPKPD
jgi:hypothetical protein